MSLTDQLEALLFVADQPASTKSLSAALQVTEGQVEQALEILEARLEERGSLCLAKLAGGFQLCTKPEFAPIVATFLKPQRQRLSKSLLEVLAIVAYKQPITMAEIEEVRGVQSDYSVRALVDRRLIQDVGRKKVPGRPMLYGTTPEFLHQFKLDSLRQLPNLEVEGDVLARAPTLALFEE